MDLSRCASCKYRNKSIHKFHSTIECRLGLTTTRTDQCCEWLEKRLYEQQANTWDFIHWIRFIDQLQLAKTLSVIEKSEKRRILREDIPFGQSTVTFHALLDFRVRITLFRNAFSFSSFSLLSSSSALVFALIKKKSA